jgi:hypothetical protein
MANGGYFDEQQWQELEGPLLILDPVISEFAASYGLKVTRNKKDWPERSIEWSNNKVRCLIQIYLATEESPLFTIWFSASRDKFGKRYWKHETPIKGQPISEFTDRLPELLREGREKLIAWSNDPSTLEYATNTDWAP